MDSELNSSMRDNFTKIYFICYEAAPKFLRKVFYEFWEELFAKQWKDNAWFGEKLTGISGIDVVIEKLYIQRKVESGCSKSWDLPLLLDILTVISSTYDQIHLRSCDLSTFTTKNTDYLKRVRNEIAHSGSLEMGSEEFQKIWRKLSSILISMGMGECELHSPYIHFQANPDFFNLAEEFITKGNALYGVGEFSKVVEVYSKGLSIKKLPHQLVGPLYINRAAALLKSGSLEGAEKDAIECTIHHPSWFRGYMMLGKIYALLHEYDNAILNFQLAIKLGDQSSESKKCIEHIQTMARIHEMQEMDRFNIEARFCASQIQCLSLNVGVVPWYETMRLLPTVDKSSRKYLEYTKLVASKPAIVEIDRGSGKRITNSVVLEAYHTMGEAYQYGKGVKANLRMAEAWYLKAIKYGFAPSANNLGLIYEIKNPQKALEAWKLSALLGDFNGINNVAWFLEGYFTTYGLVHSKEVEEWCRYALYKGSVEFISCWKKYCSYQVTEPFDSNTFLGRLRRDLTYSTYMAEILQQIDKHWNEITNAQNLKKVRGHEKYTMNLNRLTAINQHKENVYYYRNIRRSNNWGFEYTLPSKEVPTSSEVNFSGLLEIYFDEMDDGFNGTVHAGRFINLKVIQDVEYIDPSIILLVEDEQGDLASLYVFNYQKNQNLNNLIGNGTHITIFYPYCITLQDGSRYMRVDDPNLIVNRSRLLTRNIRRYSGKSEGTPVSCKSCQCSEDVYYCTSSSQKESRKLNNFPVRASKPKGLDSSGFGEFLVALFVFVLIVAASIYYSNPNQNNH